MNPRSLRFRLIVWHVALLTGVFVLFGACVYAGLKNYLEGNLTESLVRRGSQIAETLLAQINATGEAYVAREIEARYTPEINDRFIRVSYRDGRVLYVSGLPRDMSFEPGQVPKIHANTRHGAWRKEAVPQGDELLIATIPFAVSNESRFLVEVGAPLRPIHNVLDRLLLWLAAGFLLVIGVAVAGGHWLVARSLSPVERIARSAEQITFHNLSERLPVAQTGDELERLSVALNHMITRLDEAFRHNRRFMADASHEMRTPLTIIRGELESVVGHAKFNEELREAIASALEEVERLTQIVESLFGLARLDAGEAQEQWERFDLARLVASTSEQMCLLAEDKQIALSCHAAQPVFVEGDRSRLKQVIVNLLDNAIKYTLAGGAIELKVSSSRDKAILEVADTGVGIPAEEQPHVFERFYRVDKTRSREVGGAGLGLAIVKSICSAHGGHVEVESVEGCGSTFRVELPLVNASSENIRKVS